MSKQRVTIESNADHESGTVETALGRPSQCRQDVLSGRWVIFAPGRSRRPSEIIERELPATSGSDCPFCAGNEEHTPPATFCVRPEDATEHDWLVRVVPNLFPAVSPEQTDGDGAAGGDALEALRRSHQQAPDWETAVLHDGATKEPLVQRGGSRTDEPDWDLLTGGAGRRPLEYQGGHAGSETNGQETTREPNELAGKPPISERADLFPAYHLHGGHEVIVETPHHVESLTQLPPSHAAAVFQAYAERMKFWFEVPGIEYVVTFKNMGAAAGASLRHTHSQLIATSLLPPAASETGQRMIRHYEREQGCLLCEMLEAERSDGRRIVWETESLVAYCPFASRLPYLLRVVPKRHLDRFELESDATLAELAELTQRLVGIMESMFSTCAYNYTIHTRPRHVACAESYHWWLELFPRLTKVAGFEWGSDCYINPVTPEVAAEQLRSEQSSIVPSAERTDPVEYSD